MSHTPHELAADFPDMADRIRDLRAQDAHFAKLADAYHDLNARVFKAESNLEPVDTFTEVQLRKQRAALKDQLYALLSATA